MTEIESLSAAFSDGGTAKYRKDPCQEVREPLEPQECCVWPKTFESVARNELVRCHYAAATFRGHSPHGQIIGQNEMYRTSAYHHLLCKFSDGDTMVLHDQSQHLVNELVISACWGPTGTSVAIHRRPAIFESVVPLLNVCDAHGISPKTRWIFRMVSTWLSPSFWQNLMQYRYRVVPSFSQKLTMRRALRIHSHSHAGCTRLTLSADRKKKQVCAWRSPPPARHSTPPVLHLFSRKKIHVRYFLNKPRISKHFAVNI